MPHTEEKLYNVLARSPLVREIKRRFQQATRVPLRLTPPRSAAEVHALLHQTAGSPCNQQPGVRVDGAPGGRALPTHGLACRHRQGLRDGGCPCRHMQAVLAHELGRKLTAHARTCPNGRTSALVPILVGGRHVASLQAGPLCHRRTRGTNGTAVVSERQERGWLGLLRLLAQQIAGQGLRRQLPRENDPPAVAAARRHIEAHLTEPLRCRAVAARVGLSVPYFCEVFKRTTGETFGEYVTRQRLSRARELLRTTDQSIVELHANAGFQSLAQFNRVFKRRTGQTPDAWRKAQRYD